MQRSRYIHVNKNGVGGRLREIEMIASAFSMLENADSSCEPKARMEMGRICSMSSALRMGLPLS